MTSMISKDDKMYQSDLLKPDNNDENQPLNANKNIINIQIDNPAESTSKPHPIKNGQCIQSSSAINNGDLSDSDVDVSLLNNDDTIIETNSSIQFRFYSCLNTLDYYDKYYSSHISVLDLGCLFEIFMLIPTFLYSFIGIAILIMIYSIIFHSLLYVVNVMICLVSNECIKRSIKRKRPILNSKVPQRLLHLSGVLLVKKTPSMPSGDTAQCTVVALTIIYTLKDYYHIPGLWWLIAITIPITAFGRIYFGKHYIGDTIMGFIEGFIICYTIFYTVGPYLFFDK